MERLQHLHCKYFRLEDSHAPGQVNQKFGEKSDLATGHYWCLQTMMVSGPDANPVDPDDCHEGRACYFKK
jgi:hypothetical protein